MQSNIYEDLLNKELTVLTIGQSICGKLTQIDGDILIVKSFDKRGNLLQTHFVNKNMIDTISVKAEKIK